MKKLYLLFVMCLTTVMLSASGVELPHKAKMSPVMKKAVMDTVSPGYGLGGAQDTIRIDVAGNVTVYSELDEEGNKRYIFYAEADSNQIVIMANMEDLVTGVYDNISGYCVRPNHMPVYGVSGNVNLQVGYAISTIVGTFLGSDGNIYVITGHFPTPRIYTINVRVPACGEYEPAVISPAITDFSLPMTFEATTGWYTASFPAAAGVQYAIVDKNNQDNVPVRNVNGDWWPMFGPSSMNTLGDTTTLYYDWSDTIEYQWLACLQQTNPGDNDQPIEDGYIHFWGMSINKNIVSATNEMFCIQLTFRNMNNLLPGFYTSQQNQFNLSSCWIQDQMTGQRETAQMIDAEVRDNNGSLMVEATIITQTGMMYQVRLFAEQQGVGPVDPVDPTPGDSTEVIPSDTIPQQPVDTTSQQPITPSERDYTVRVLPPYGNYQPALYFTQQGTMQQLTAGNDGWYSVVLHHEVDYDYQSFRVVEYGNTDNYIERNVWGEWYDMSAGIIYDDTTTVITLDYSAESYRWHADAPVVVPDTIRIDCTSEYTTTNYGSDIVFAAGNSLYATQLDIYMTEVTPGTYTSANGDFDLSYTIVRDNQTYNYVYASAAEATLRQEGDIMYLTCMMTGQDGKIYLINMQKSLTVQTITIDCPNEFAYREYADDDMVVAATTDDYYVQLNFATNNVQPGTYTNEHFLMQYTALFTSSQQPITGASEITANVTVENGVTSISATIHGQDGNTYLISMYGVLPNNAVEPGGNDSTEVVPGDSTIIVPNDSVAPGTRNYMVRIATPTCGTYQPALYFEEDQLTVPMMQENSGWYRAILNHEIDYSYHSFNVVENNNPNNKIEMNAWVEWFEASAGIVYDDTTTIISLNYSDTVRFRWSACNEEPIDPDTTYTQPDTIYITFADAYVLNIDPVAGELGVSTYNEEYRIYLRFSNENLQDGVYTNNDFNLLYTYIEKNYQTFAPETISATVTTENGVKNIHVVMVSVNGNIYIIDLHSEQEQGGGEGGNTNIPDGAIVINCPNDFTWRGSSSDAYFEADGNDYHVQFNIRTNNLQPGHYDVSRFWTGSYTYVQPDNGSRINSSTVSADITKQGRKTYVALTMVGTDGNTYYITMHGINPGAPYEPEPGDTLTFVMDANYTYGDSTFTLSGDTHDPATFTQYTFNLNFSGDVWGENMLIGGERLKLENMTYYRVRLDASDNTSLTIHEDRSGTMHVVTLGNDSLYYEMDITFHLPYPHTYTVSVLTPEDCEQTPVLFRQGGTPMVYDPISGRYTLTLEATEGETYHFMGDNNAELQEVKHFSDSYYEPSASTYEGYFYEDTVIVLDLRHPVLAVNRYSVDTIFYKWSNCDTYNTEFVETETGYGLVVRKPYTLNASKAAELSPASVHLYYTLPLNEYNVYLGTPDHGQLFITDSVDLHLSRFVKDDVLGRVSAYQRAIQDMQNPGSTFYASENSLSSALINQGNVTADTIQQHTLFYPEQWHFMALPFDAKRSDIQLGEGTYAAIRRFLPAEQAAGNYFDVWEDLAMNDTIHAGEGYIYQFYKVMEDEQIMPSSAADGSGDGSSEWTYGKNFAEVLFTALPTANKQRMFVNSEQTVALNHHAATYVWNKNWNLISNPYESFYNVHNCGSNGIITVYGSGSNRDAASGAGGDNTYSYISLNDDYYVLRPGEAFFYQAADNEQSITFPLAGCQLTANPDSSFMYNDGYDYGYEAPRVASRMAGRDLYNFYLSDGTNEDRARVVINPSASMDYEVGRDALKLTPFTLTTPLFYVEDEHVQMAINERPMRDGIIYLSAQLPAAGTYSIRLQEKTMGTVMLLDTENGTMTDLSEGDYIFNESAGTYTRRFIISVIGSATDLQNAASADENVIKILENNRVYIIRSGEKYDVLGNRVDK